MKPIAKEELLFASQAPVHSGTATITMRRGKKLSVDGCALMRVRSGSATMSINASQVEVEVGMVLFIAFDMTVIPVINSEIKVDFIALDYAVTGDIFFSITSSSFWNSIYTKPTFHPTHGLAGYLDRMFLQAQWVQERFSRQISDTVLGSEINSLFILLAAEVGDMNKDTTSFKTRAWTIANDFITLLHRHYARHHDVAYYAEALNISADYLNVICKENIGYTAKSRINSQTVIAIKTLLDTTDMPIKSIAEHLHYDDPSYMCRVFRRHTGQTPLQYRNRHLK